MKLLVLICVAKNKGDHTASVIREKRLQYILVRRMEQYYSFLKDYF